MYLTTNLDNQVNKKKILVINCGGTISMYKENNVYVPMKGNILAAIKNYPSIFVKSELDNQFCLTNTNFYFELVELENLIDSSNLHPKDWIEIVEMIESNSGYDGYVVLHGTDTLAYTAAALSFMIQNLNKPIVVTGSQIPLIKPKSDGLTNFIGSLMMAGETCINQVCVFFENKLFQGNRVKKVSSISTNAFLSPNFPLLGSVNLKPQLLYKPVENQNRTLYHKKVSSGIKILKIYPSFDVDILAGLNIDNTRALTLETFGSGNAPSNQDFLSAIDRLVNEGVLIINVTQCLEGAVCNEYETGNELSRTGVISGKNISTEAAYAKLHFLFSCYEDLNFIREAFTVNIVNEMND